VATVLLLKTLTKMVLCAFAYLSVRAKSKEICEKNILSFFAKMLMSAFMLQKC